MFSRVFSGMTERPATDRWQSRPARRFEASASLKGNFVVRRNFRSGRISLRRWRSLRTRALIPIFRPEHHHTRSDDFDRSTCVAATVLPLAVPETALDIDLLALGQKFSSDLSKTLPGDAYVELKRACPDVIFFCNKLLRW